MRWRETVTGLIEHQAGEETLFPDVVLPLSMHRVGSKVILHIAPETSVDNGVVLTGVTLTAMADLTNVS